MSDNSAKTICFDLDGTLCTNTWGDYEAAEPFPWAIERANALAAAGHRIVVFTARGTATGIDWSEVTRAQLDRWGVQYDDVKFGKPSAAVYVDDRAVHTTAWRRASAGEVPGAGAVSAGPEWLPAAPAPHAAAVVEVGRTYDGRPGDVEAHVERALDRARSAGVRFVPPARDLCDRVLLGLDRFPPAPGDDSVWSLTLFDGASAAHLDLWEDDAPPDGVDLGVRPLSEAAAGLRRLLCDDDPDLPPAVAAATPSFPAARAWPVVADRGGRVHDRLGGCLAAVLDDALLLERESGPPSIAARRLREMAARIGIAVARAPLDLAALKGADEAFVAGEPFCLVPVGTVDAFPPAGGAPGEVTQRLAAAWSDASGIDLLGQLGRLTHRDGVRL